MLSQVQSQPTKSDRTVAPTKILESRIQYQSCRIRVPDLEQPVAAILVDRHYYKTLLNPYKIAGGGWYLYLLIKLLTITVFLRISKRPRKF